MVATTIEQQPDVDAGKKLLNFSLGPIENPSADQMATVIIEELKGLEDLGPVALTLMAAYLRNTCNDVNNSLEESIVNEALAIVETQVGYGPQAGSTEEKNDLSLEKEFAFIAKLSAEIATIGESPEDPKKEDLLAILEKQLAAAKQGLSL